MTQKQIVEKYNVDINSFVKFLNANSLPWSVDSVGIVIEDDLIEDYIAKYKENPDAAEAAASPAEDPNAPKLGMKWYKFLIYFALFASAVLNFLSSLTYFTGSVYFSASNGAISAEQVYAAFGVLKIIDIAYGAYIVAFAIFALVLRSHLAGYSAKAPKMVTVFYAISAAVPLVYNLVTGAIVGVSVVGDAAVSIIINLIFLVANIRYFKRRAHLFVN